MKTKKRQTRKPTSARTRKILDASLRELERAELVRAPISNDAEYAFKHALVQDTALSTLLRGEYKRLNLLVAQAYEKIYTNRDLDEYAARLAQHYDAAGDDAKTLDYSLRAGDRAMRVYANTEAIAFYTQALDAASRSEPTTEQWIHLYAQRGRAYELNAQYDAALANYDELEQLGQQRGEPALELAALMARLPIFATPTAKYDPTKAEGLANQALTLAREIGDRAAEAKTLWLRMLTMVRSMRPQNGIADGEAALVIARELNLREQLAYTLHDLASAYFAIGQFERAQAHGLEARVLWRELDNKPMLADNLAGTGNSLTFLGEFDQVIALSDEAFQISQAIGNLWGQAYSLAMVGQAHEERGDTTRALTAMQNCIRCAEQAGFFVPQIQTRALLAQLYFRIGAFEQAKQIAQYVLDLQSQQGAMVHPLSIALRARLYLVRNELAQAQVALAQAEAQFHAHGTASSFFRLILDLARIQLALARGEFGHALEQLESLIQEMRVVGVKLFLPEMIYEKGQALLVIGDRDAAERTLWDAERYAQQIGSRRMRWQILASLSEIARTRGNAERAAQLSADARHILDYIVSNMPSEFRDGFLNLPRVRAVMDT